MLADALRVVEAARALGIGPGRAGIYNARCDPLRLPRAMRELAQAIEGFDAATARGADVKAMLGRALRYAAARGIDPREMAVAIGADRSMAPSDEEASDLVPLPGEVDAPDDLSDVSVSRQAHLHGDPVSGGDPEPPASYGDDGDAAPDADEREGDVAAIPPPRPPAPEAERRARDAALMAEREAEIRVVEERLASIAEATGWTPALKAIDAQVRRAYGALGDPAAPGAGAAAVEAGRLLALADEAVRRLEEGLDEDPDAAPAARGFAPR